MIDITIGGVFIAGLLSFVSPCVLPIVPPYLCFLAGVSLEQLESGGEMQTPALTQRIVLAALAFVAGFGTIFVLLGATASFFGQMLREIMSWTVSMGGWEINIVAALAGAVILIMGLHFLGLFRIGFLYREARVHVERKPAGLLGAYGIGLAFAFGWTPCIGPVLAAILAIAGTEDTVGQGAGLLAVYAMGLGLPFIGAAAFSRPFLRWASRFRKNMVTVERVMGGMLVFTGILFITGRMSAMSYWLLETFPVLGTIG